MTCFDKKNHVPRLDFLDYIWYNYSVNIQSKINLIKDTPSTSELVEKLGDDPEILWGVIRYLVLELEELKGRMPKCNTCNDAGMLDIRHKDDPGYANRAMKNCWAGEWIPCPDCERGRSIQMEREEKE